MSDKQYFVDTLNDIWTLIQHERSIDDALHALDSDFGGFSMSKAICLAVDMLQKMYNDEFEYIDYFLFELDFGTDESYYDNEDGTPMHNSDGTPIPLRTPSDLYDLIMDSQDPNNDAVYTLNKEAEKYKALYENEKSHTETLEKLIQAKNRKIQVDEEYVDKMARDAVSQIDQVFKELFGDRYDK